MSDQNTQDTQELDELCPSCNNAPIEKQGVCLSCWEIERADYIRDLDR